MTKNRTTFFKVFIVIIIAINSTSCLSVKGYEKMYLSDPDMKLSSTATDRFETNFQVYREASAGANGGKTGGGCGCN